jgi:hypothetical protein
LSFAIPRARVALSRIAVVVQRGTVDRRTPADTSRAHVGFAAQVAVIARRAVAHRLSFALTRTRVARARVALVVQVGTVDRRAPAETVRARIVFRAQITIIAGRTVNDWRVGAARSGITRVVRADVGVIAIRRGPTDAHTDLARVRGRAGVAVVAGCTVDQRLHLALTVGQVAHTSVARVIQRRAVDGHPTDACVADITDRAQTVVLAGTAVVRGLGFTPGRGVADSQVAVVLQSRAVNGIAARA